MGELAKCYCIANTGYSDLETKIKCYSAGMDFFLTKPLEFTQLYELIMRLFPIIWNSRNLIYYEIQNSNKLVL